MAEAKRLTAHFNLREFHQKDGRAEVPESHEEALRHWCEYLGEPLREKFGAVTIVSGYRSRPYNNGIAGAARGSYHIYDEHESREVAVDFKCARGNPAAWRREVIRLLDRRYGKQRGGVGYYPRGGFVHADTRINGRAYWNGP